MLASNAFCIQLRAHLPDQKKISLSDFPASCLVLPWLLVDFALQVTRIGMSSHACTSTRHVAAQAHCMLSTWKSAVCHRALNFSL